MTLITLEAASKVFGKNTDLALTLIDAGENAADIRAQTGATVALAETSLSISDGEVFMIMGLSGSGKSTLLRLINRLITPTSGKVLIDGVDIGPLSAEDLRALRRKRLAMVFQGFGLLPHRSVLENIGFGLEIQGRGKEERQHSAETWIERVGLSGFADSLPHELSGGMRQRVGLARALASGADILLMDEPFSALDPLIRREMQDLLLDLQRDLNKTIVFVTHDLAEAVKMGTRIAILQDGRLVQIGSGREIIDHPADAYVRAFTEDLRLRTTP